MENQLSPRDFTGQNVFDFKVKTKYCVTPEKHLEQVKHAIARGLPTVDADEEVKYDPLAIVCSGPSLKDTWTEVKKFRYILSMSGSHDFLLDRGIKPIYHAECDPRQHKSQFLKKPQEGIKYLIASCCHADVFDALNGMDIRLWHIMGSEKLEQIPDVYPKGQWVLSGGSNVGLRSLVLARIMGFTNIHIFGMDCSLAEGKAHANYHPKEPLEQQRFDARIGAKTYQTTEVFMEYAKQFFHEVTKLTDSQVTLHGLGMLQHLVYQKSQNPIEVLEMISKRAEKTTLALAVA